MIKTPTLKATSGATHLMSGSKLNELVAAIQARTQMDAAEVGPRGMAGQNPKGGGPKIPKFRQRFDDKKVYVLSPGFLARLEQALHMRTPREAQGLDAQGWNIGGGGINAKLPRAGTGARALVDVFAAVKRATPRDAAETSPLGYRFPPDPRAPRLASLILRTEDVWAEAFYCSAIFHDGTIYTTRTDTETFTKGKIVTTTTQDDIGPHLYNASHPYFSCPSPTEEDDEVHGKDYGTFVSSDTSYSGSITPMGAYDLASDELEPTGTVVDLDSWHWNEYSRPPTVYATYQMARWSNPGRGDYIIHKPRYKWSNTGKLHIRIQWKEATASYDTTEAPGEDSDWYDSHVPTPINTYSLVREVVLLKS